MGGVHPCGFKAAIACMLDIDMADMPDIEGMLDIEFAEDMAGMPDVEGILDVDGDSDAIPDMGGIEFSGIAESMALLCGIGPAIGSFIDILGINIGVDDDSIILLSVMEPFIESPIDISCIAVPADILEPPIIIPDITCAEDEGMLVFTLEEESRPRPVPA